MVLIRRLCELILIELLVVEVTHSQLPESYSLYDEKDSVIVLNWENFEHYVYNQNAFTLVNFYIHWCGHCIQFSPIWKQFGDDIKKWKSIVRVAAIDGAHDKNMVLCQKHGISAFPRIQIFLINAESGAFGQSFGLEDHSVGALRTQLIDFLLRSQTSFSNRINISPISVTSKAELFNTLPINMEKHNLIFLESKPTHLGAEVLMKLIFDLKILC